MAESQTNRDSEPGGDKAQAEGIVLPIGDAEFSDDAPTVISKSIPVASPSASTLNEALGGNLRGRTLAHFELEEAIGVGGMAAVIRARDKQLDRSVALKVLPPEMAGDKENVRRFHQEARAAAKLDHENIARAFYCGEDQNLHFIAFEFVEGENLRAILEKRGKLPVAEAVRYMLQIATGLEHAASRGVVHRDIKPSNIIITPTGRAKLVDMGLARSLEPHNDKALTQSGVTLGTFDYISPEQALEPRDADTRSDIYSLGCTFYHMLTGQAPVPEGTAAKKLHHHHHVPPIDPRQLNPEIPDEVAAVLARMMAKDPKDRYQRPLHLVQHLMQVAQKVGAADDVPEGVLFVDAPLPNAPRKRPLLMVSLASLFLGLLLFLLSLAPSGQGLMQVSNSNGKNENRKPKSLQGDQKPPRYVATADDIVLNSSADLENLRKVLEQNDRPPNHVVIGNVNLDLTDSPLIFHGTEGKDLVVIEAKETPATLRFRHQGGADEKTPQIGILVEGGKVVFRNLRFEIEGNVTPKVLVAGVAVKNGGVLSFQKCTFVQKGFPEQALIGQGPKRIPLASVAIDNLQNGDKLPRVILDDCYFETGQDAVAVYGAGEIYPVNNCAFGPHNSLFHLRAGKSAAESVLKLKNCSARGLNGPAFRLDGDGRCLLEVDYSIFSRSDNPLIAGDDPAFIRQTDSPKPLVRYFSKRNCYHNLGVLWGLAPAAIIGDPEAFKTEVVKARGGSEPSRESSFFLPGSVSPWAYAEPVDSSLKFFQVRFDSELVRKEREIALGVQKCVWGNMMELPRLPDDVKVASDPKLKPNVKVVDPDIVEMTQPGFFRTLAQAIILAKPGDVILIKSNREVAVKPAVLDQTKTDLTIKPYQGYRPILTLDETLEPHAYLFKLLDGKLHMESLEFLLRPLHSGFKSQAVVSLVGNGKCTFKQCLFTLKDVERVPLRVVVLESPDSVMKMPKAVRSTPEVIFKDCMVRGDGDLVRILASRPLDLDLDNSLIALAGNLLSVKSSKDAPMDPVNLKMNHVSAFLAEQLVHLASSPLGKGLAITKVDAKDCLFVALGGKSLVHLDGIDIEENKLDKVLAWSGNHNAYSGFDMMLDQKRPEEINLMPTIRKDAKSWKDLFGEQDAKHVQARFAMKRPLFQALLDDFRALPDPKVDLQNYGAVFTPERMPPLAAPAEENNAEEKVAPEVKQ
jgi:serine/threonine protein kinase